ncbi:putative retrotransposon hot spot protein 4 (RHS4) [Trypanosoma vivax]|nr:putative retrotransposon hot spot protein 4 (RHS4) [Trypanosoma vivax]
MDDVIREPQSYIPDADVRRRVLNLSACQTYALVCKVVPQLQRNGITSVLEWGGADESGIAKRAVRNAVADDGLWNTTRCLPDAAFSAAKDADARVRFEWKRFDRAVIEDKMRRESLMITMER